MAIISSHTLNGMNGTHAGEFPVRLINITQNSEIFSSSMDSNGRLEKNIDLSLTDATDFIDTKIFKCIYAGNVNGVVPTQNHW